MWLYAQQPYQWTGAIAGYLGLILLGIVFISCGLFVSSLTDSQAIAFFISSRSPSSSPRGSPEAWGAAFA